MAKKKTGLSSTLFRDINPYGEDEGGQQGELVQLALAEIRPDPGQPRRLLPPHLLQQLADGASPGEVLDQWLAPGNEGQAGRIHELRKLASSIARHGLINPITVREVGQDERQTGGGKYLIVTGERRYWAHHLLVREGRAIQAGDQTLDPGRIGAIVTRPGITVRAHQLIENIMREDINAVEKGLGLWALRYELSGVADGEMDSADWVNYSSPPPDVELVPWTAVSDALGISKRYRIFITSVLNLAPPALALVQTHNLAEMTIRPIVQKLRARPDLQVRALTQLIAWQQEAESDAGPPRGITRAVKSLVDQLLAQDKLPVQETDKGQIDQVQRASQTQRFSKKIHNTTRFLQRLEPSHLGLVARDLALDMRYADTLAELQELREQLDTLLTRVADYRQQESG